jgi:hypothetical protein
MSTESGEFASPMSVPSAISSGMGLAVVYLIYHNAYVMGQSRGDRGSSRYMTALCTLVLAVCGASAVVAFVKFID